LAIRAASVYGKSARLGRAAVAGATASLAAVLAAAGVLPTAHAPLTERALAALEGRFARPEIGDAAAITGVIALGGNDDRIREAGRLARRYPHMLVVVSGAGTPAHVLSVLGEGIEPRRVLVETQSRNTHENAIFSANLIASKGGDRWLLVTSASHMPRAIGAFRKRDLMVEAWPIHDLARHAPERPAVAQHEALGLVAYWLLGRTSALFPSETEGSGTVWASLLR
jgi:uncharacterized SAM-binding protein YcdF (DUF218 family)